MSNWRKGISPPNKLNWVPYEELIIELYVNQRMSVKSILDKLHVQNFEVSGSSLLNFLSSKQLKRIQKKQNLKKSEKFCEKCNKVLDPPVYRRKWCIDCSGNRKFSWYLQKYGLSKPEFDEMLTKQRGICVLCERKAKVVDHDHITGKIRGILCYACNFAVSRVEKDGWAVRAQHYVESFK